MLFARKKKEVVAVMGMSCGHCEDSVEKAVQALTGVEKVKASHTRNEVVVSYADSLDVGAVRSAITELGYEVSD